MHHVFRPGDHLVTEAIADPELEIEHGDLLIIRLRGDKIRRLVRVVKSKNNLVFEPQIPWCKTELHFSTRKDIERSIVVIEAKVVGKYSPLKSITELEKD